jgi:hypothetical protein
MENQGFEMQNILIDSNDILLTDYLWDIAFSLEGATGRGKAGVEGLGAILSFQSAILSS